MLTWTQMQTKAVRLSRDTNPATRIQLAEDMNTGCHMFNAKLARYFSRKQQFTNIVANQSIYQTPIDSVRVTGMGQFVTSTFETPIREIRSEEEWRQITAYKSYASSWPAFYFVLGNDEIQIWPVPSQAVTNGLRFYYQQQDYDLSVEDIVSTALTPVQTVTMTNGSTLVTSTGSTFSSQLKGLMFQNTSVTNLTWYEIVDVPTTSTLTLKSAFVGPSAASLAFRIGQMPIIPGQYHDAPVHYALGLFFMSKGNAARAQYHLGSDEPGKRGMFWSMVNDAISEYSSSSTSNVIIDDPGGYNPWFLTPTPAP